VVDVLGKLPMKATVVRVTIERGKSGLFLATSPDLKGLLVAEHSLVELEREIPVSIAALFTANGEDFVIIQAEDMAGEQPVKSWVKVPAGFSRNKEFA